MQWLFLVHQVCTPNSRERVRVWRAIKRTGAILYRNSVYVLPYSRERLEDFQWACQEVSDSHGEASVFVSNAQTREEDAAIRSLFQKAREEEYAALLVSAERLRSQMKSAAKRGRTRPHDAKNLARQAQHLRASFEGIRVKDFFSPSPPRRIVEILKWLASWKAAGEEPRRAVSAVVPRSARNFQKKVWVTRAGIHIDRISSAWLIRRFIDPSARFAFAPEGKFPNDAIPFDVLGAEFSHHGQYCTFETLVKAFRIRDRALAQIAEIVHDIDLKDHAFGRIEASGLDLVIRALSASIKDDHRLLDAGSPILDGLYQYLSENRGRATWTIPR